MILEIILFIVLSPGFVQKAKTSLASIVVRAAIFFVLVWLLTPRKEGFETFEAQINSVNNQIFELRTAINNDKENIQRMQGYLSNLSLALTQIIPLQKFDEELVANTQDTINQLQDKLTTATESSDSEDTIDSLNMIAVLTAALNQLTDFSGPYKDALDTDTATLERVRTDISDIKNNLPEVIAGLKEKQEELKALEEQLGQLQGQLRKQQVDSELGKDLDRDSEL
jgi:chromosome segregation ATPase